MSDPNPLVDAFQSICAMDAPLNARLAAYAGKLREFAPHVAEAYDELVARLAAGGIGADAPRVGDAMPPFVLPGEDARLVTLEGLLAQGPIVLSFNRGHWCPLCRLEVRSLLEAQAELDRFGARVVSVVPERQGVARRLRLESGEALTVLSDIDNGYALSLGLVLWLGDRLQRIMEARGLHLEAFQGERGWFVPLPATYVIGRSGRVLARHVDAEFRTRMDVAEVLSALASEAPAPPRLAGGGQAT